ncbi:MAG: helix-turn-helix domain-containing protein [Nitrospirae bacterium]|nr:helix-turn-helix domain-containing protein [Nitrospirota bacterium]
MERVLTITEVSQLLRLDESEVRNFVERGELPGFRLNNVWRCRERDLQEFLEKKVEEQRIAVLRSHIEDPTEWAKLLIQDPELRRNIENADYPPGSFGEFLKKGWKSL